MSVLRTQLWRLLGLQTITPCTQQDSPHQLSLLGVWVVSSFLSRGFAFPYNAAMEIPYRHNFELANTFTGYISRNRRTQSKGRALGVWVDDVTSLPWSWYNWQSDQLCTTLEVLIMFPRPSSPEGSVISNYEPHRVSFLRFSIPLHFLFCTLSILLSIFL